MRELVYQIGWKTVSEDMDEEAYQNLKKSGMKIIIERCMRRECGQDE